MEFSPLEADSFGGAMCFKEGPSKARRIDKTEDADDAPDDVEANGRIYRRPFADPPQVVAFKYAEEFADALDISPGCRYFAYVSGRFVFGDLLMALLNRRKMSYKRLTIQNLSLNKGNIETIANLIDAMGGRMESLDLLLSDYWYAHYRNDLLPYLYELVDVGKVPALRIGFARTHAKVIAAESLRGNKVVMHGSANLRSSDNIEQFSLEADGGLYDFVTSCVDEILRTHDTINADTVKHKSVGSEASWNSITSTFTA